MATATKATKGFQVSCPCCGANAEDAGITLDVNDLGNLTCASCDDTFTPAAAVALAAEQLRRWEALARWIDSAAGMMAGE